MTRYGGTQQSGIAFNLRIANLASDGQILNVARQGAEAVLNAHPELLETPAHGVEQYPGRNLLSPESLGLVRTELRPVFKRHTIGRRSVDVSNTYIMREKEFLPLVEGKLGIKELNPMQRQMMSRASESRDIILLSPTGSGKTLAFHIADAPRFLRPSTGRVQAVVVARRENL